MQPWIRSSAIPDAHYLSRMAGEFSAPVIRDRAAQIQTGRCGFLQMLDVTKQSSYNNACDAAKRPQTQSEAGHRALVPHRFRQSRLRRAQHHTAEIEKIIEELASHSFSRAEFLKRLDRFYLAIGQPLPPSMEVLTVSREDI